MPITLRLLAVFSVSLLMATSPAARQPNTRTIYVSALDGKQAPVAGLTAADFVVKEDGKSREVVDAQVATAPVQVVFMLDDSGLGLGSIRQGAWEMVQAFRGKGEFAVIAIGSQNVVVQDFTAEPQTVYTGLSRLLTRNNPAGYVLDGLLEVTRGLQRREAQRPIIVLVATEGQEFSNSRPEDVLDAVQASRAQVYYIGLGAPVTQGVRPALDANRPHDSTEDEAVTRNVVLGSAPKNSGGRSEQVLQTNAIPVVMKQFAADIAGQYAVTYRSEADRAKLSVDTPRKGVKVRAPARIGRR
jgi:VWFA-related protein